MVSRASPSPSYITNRELATQPVGSPGLAVLRFWQDIQYQDFPNALAEVTPGFASTYAGSLQHFALYVSAEQARWMVTPRIHNVSLRHAGEATVLVTYPFGGTQTVTVFDLQRIRGVWLISYNFYLTNRLTARATNARR